MLLKRFILAKVSRNLFGGFFKMFYLLFLKLVVFSQFDLEKSLRQYAEFQRKALKRRELCLPGRQNDGQRLCV